MQKVLGDKRIRKFFRASEANDNKDFNPNWLQRTIAICAKIGISKKELYENYYINEIPIIMQEYADLNKVESKDETEVGAEDF